MAASDSVFVPIITRMNSIRRSSAIVTTNNQKVGVWAKQTSLLFFVFELPLTWFVSTYDTVYVFLHTYVSNTKDCCSRGSQTNPHI
jgi:hypothetical protein